MLHSSRIYFFLLKSKNVLKIIKKQLNDFSHHHIDSLARFTLNNLFTLPDSLLDSFLRNWKSVVTWINYYSNFPYTNGFQFSSINNTERQSSLSTLTWRRFSYVFRFYTIHPFKGILSAATRSDIDVMLYNDDDDYVDEKNPLINKENCPRFWAWLPLVEAKEKLQLWKTFTFPSMSRSYCFTTHPIGKHLRLFAYRSFIPITLLPTCSCYCKCSSSLSAMSTPTQRLQRSSDAFWICINVKVLSCPWSLMSTADLGLFISFKHHFIHKTEHPYAKLIHLCHHSRLRWTYLWHIPLVMF